MPGLDMTNISSSSRLLQLPRELRDKIYAYLLLQRTEPPLNPSFPGERIQRDCIAHPKRYSSWRYPNLVWVNRQLRNEYFDLVEEYSKAHRIGAELDIMNNGYTFYPTWLYLPPDIPSEMPFDLTVHVRIFSTEPYLGNDASDARHYVGFRCLFRLLVQLIHHGPSFGHHLELWRGRWLFVIGRLSVNISFDEACDPETRSETMRNFFRMLKALAVDGVAKKVIKKIHVRAEYELDSVSHVYDREWAVSERLDAGAAMGWRQAGFLGHNQRCLSDDYRYDESEDSMDFM